MIRNEPKKANMTKKDEVIHSGHFMIANVHDGPDASAVRSIFNATFSHYNVLKKHVFRFDAHHLATDKRNNIAQALIKQRMFHSLFHEVRSALTPSPLM